LMLFDSGLLAIGNVTIQESRDSFFVLIPWL
jgi:hypothetical protein